MQVKVIGGQAPQSKTMAGEDETTAMTQKAGDQLQSLRAQCSELQTLVKQKESIIRSCTDIFLELAQIANYTTKEDVAIRIKL